MAQIRKKTFFFGSVVIGIGLIALVYVSRPFYYSAKTIHELLVENKHLKQAITNLTAEDQIGYAKVISQDANNSKLFTKLRFVETARDDKLKKILEKDYTIEGDIVHFDALIVKFSDKMVMDDKERALYLWRRVYGENTPPQDGLLIEQAGAEPLRYGDLLKALRMKDRNLFWSNIWDLANAPERLKEYGITAIYGNAVYSKLSPGLIYVFKITPAGQVYIEPAPEM